MPSSFLWISRGRINCHNSAIYDECQPQPANGFGPAKKTGSSRRFQINDDTPQPIHQFHVVLGPGVLVYPNPSKGLTSRLYCGCGRGIAVIVLTSMFSGGPKPLLTEFGIYHSRLETCVVYFQIRTLSNLLEVTIYNRRRKWFFF